MALPPISAKVMIDAETGRPFVVAGPNDTTPQELMVSSDAAVFFPPTDDYAGILLAGYAAEQNGAGIVQLKPITYTISGSIPLRKGVTYRGAGIGWNMNGHDLTGGTILQGDGSGNYNCFEYNATDRGAPYATGNQLKDSELDGAGILDMGITGFKYGIKAGALYQGGVSLLRIDNVVVTFSTEWNCWIENSDAVQIGTITVMEGVRGNFYFGGSGTTLWNYGDCSIKAIFSQSPRNSYKSRGVVFEARGDSTSINDIQVSHIGANGNNTQADQTATFTNGVSAIAVTDLSKLDVDMGVVLTTTIAGFTAYRTYFVKSVSAASGAGTITLSDRKGGTVITPNAGGTATLRTWGYTLLEVVGNPYLGGTHPEITYATFSHFDVEANGTVGVLLQKCKGSSFRAASSIGNNGIVMRDMGYYNHVHNAVSSTAIDCDGYSQDTTLTGVKPLTLRDKMPSGMVYDDAQYGHAIYLAGFGDNAPDIYVGDTAWTAINIGRQLRHKKTAFSGNTTWDLNHGDIMTYEGAGGHTLTLPAVVDSMVGVKLFVSNPGAGSLTVATTSSQAIIAAGTSVTSVTMATLTNATFVASKTGSTFYWARY